MKNAKQKNYKIANRNRVAHMIKYGREDYEHKVALEKMKDDV